jgi:4'-phosphopantetheinyl transferase
MNRMNAITKSGVITVPQGFLRWLVLRARQNDPLAPGAPPDFLHPTEIEHWETLKVDKRRREWTLGRRAAKELIVEQIREMTGRRLDLAQIAIIPHAHGWPIVTLPGQAGVPAITLSISHSKEMVFCAATEGANRLLGADIEAIEPRAAAFAEEYFTPLENRFLAAVPAEQATTLITAVWSGKEAALKAIRRGLAEDTRLVSCLPHPIMDGEADWLPMRIEWAAERATSPMPPLRGYWRLEGEYVMTLAFAETAVI